VGWIAAVIIGGALDVVAQCHEIGACRNVSKISDKPIW